MLVSLDALAQRYGLLPSEALDRASTFDLRVMEIANRYAARKQTLAQGKTPTPSRPKLTQQQMRAMIENSRNNPRQMKRHKERKNESQ